MTFEYYPDDIANTLFDLAEIEPTADLFKKLENAVYDLKSTAENKYNFDYFTTFYRILEKITDKHLYG